MTELVKCQVMDLIIVIFKSDQLSPTALIIETKDSASR